MVLFVVERSIFVGHTREAVAFTSALMVGLGLREAYIDCMVTYPGWRVVGGCHVVPVQMLTQPSLVLLELLRAAEATPAFPGDQRILTFRLSQYHEQLNHSLRT